MKHMKLRISVYKCYKLTLYPNGSILTKQLYCQIGISKYIMSDNFFSLNVKLYLFKTFVIELVKKCRVNPVSIFLTSEPVVIVFSVLRLRVTCLNKFVWFPVWRCLPWTFCFLIIFLSSASQLIVCIQSNRRYFDDLKMWFSCCRFLAGKHQVDLG